MVLNLSWRTICGLYALHYLAHKGGSASTQEIAQHGRLSPTFLSKTMQRLRAEGFLTSRRGLGYALARPAVSISVLEVLRSLEGPILPTDLCLMKNSGCFFRDVCPMSRLCREISSNLVGSLGVVTLSSLPVGSDGLPVCMESRKRAVQ